MKILGLKCLCCSLLLLIASFVFPQARVIAQQDVLPPLQPILPVEPFFPAEPVIPDFPVDEDQQDLDDITGLPINTIENIVGVQGRTVNGVFVIEIARDDVATVSGPQELNITFSPAFGLRGNTYFTSLNEELAFVNGEMVVTETEVNDFISALLANGLEVQAYHQSFPMVPQMWLVHFRGSDDPVVLANALRAAIDVTGVPLPQAPSSGTSVLDTTRLAGILNGEVEVNAEGTVTVHIDRTDSIFVDNVEIDPRANISSKIEFRSVNGAVANVIAKMSMRDNEVDPVLSLMVNVLGWYPGSLFIQENDEHPQLYFSYILKTGNAYDLAEEIRRGLDLTKAE